MYQGSCLCGAVKYEVTGALGPIGICHCSRCRKATASAFNAAVAVNTQDLHIRTGQASLTEFESSPGVHRVFCRNCGSHLLSRRDATPEFVRLRLGTLDTRVNAKPAMHIYVRSKADWFDILDGAPQYPGEPPA